MVLLVIVGAETGIARVHKGVIYTGSASRQVSGSHSGTTAAIIATSGTELHSEE